MKDKDHVIIEIQRPTGPRVITGPPRRQGYLERYIPRQSLSRIKQSAIAIVSVLRKPKVAAAGSTIVLALVAHLAISSVANGFSHLASFWVFSASNRAALDPSTPYTGPGDIVTFQDWFGFRCYSNAFSGTIADITDSSTGNTTGTRLQCSNGVVSSLVSGSACTFVTGNSCSDIATTCATACNVRSVYSQTGNSNCTTQCIATQATNASRPTFVVNCQNSHPCMTSSGTQNLTTGNRSLASQAQPWSLSHVSYADGTGGQYAFFTSANGNSYYASTQIHLYAGTATNTAAASNTWHAVQGVINAASSILYLDSAQTTGLSAGAGVFATGIAYVLGANNAGAGTIKWAEGGAASGAFSTGNQSALDLNQRAYWGF